MDRKERGRRAEAFLNDPLFEETIVAMEREYIETWKRAREVDVRENAHRYVMLLARFRDHLMSMALTGTLEETQERAAETRRFPWGF